MLPPPFAPFLEQRPVGVMARAIVERFFAPARLDQLFRTTAVAQYQRDLLFSSVVELMQAVVLGVEPSVFAAYRKRRHHLPVSDDALYLKLKGMELGVSAALVRDSAAQAAAVLDELGGRHPSWLPGYRVRVLDGNAPAATEHRLGVLRDTWAAPLPGKVLVVLDPERGLACDAFLTPDGHAQERSLLDDVLGTVAAGDVWVADRNFCTTGFLFGIADRQAFAVFRQHGTLQGELIGERQFVGDSPTGRVYEQAIRLRHDGRTREVRRVTVELGRPTRDGSTSLHLLTNLPAGVSAVPVAELYRKRWSIETLFYEVTQTLACEVKTLCYPAASLFVFCLALTAANSVAVLKAAVRSAHGEAEAGEMSGYYLALEVRQVYAGMMVAVPADEWAVFRRMSVGEFAGVLRGMAAGLDRELYRKSRRGPKRPPPEKTPYKNGGHVSTHKLLKKKNP